MTTHRSHRDRGFTLVEAVICIALMGLLSTVVASAIVVILRTTPAVSDRADAAVNVQGLVTWLPQDVDSAKPGSFDITPRATTGCSAPDPGDNLLKLAWSETISSTVNYAASYRYIAQAGGGHIVRVYCRVGQAPQVFKMSGLIPPWVAGAEPVTVTLTSRESAGPIDTVTFEVEPIAGKTIVLKATTKNPNENLPPPPAPPTTLAPPPPPPNQPPVAVDAAYTISSATPVAVTLTATDPENGTLTAAVGPAGVPVGWTVTVGGPMSFTVTAPAAAAGTSVVVVFKVSDGAGGVDDANITFNVAAAAANRPPQANPASVSTRAGASVVVALPASDPEGLALTAVVTSVPSGWTATVNSLNVTITVPTNAVVGVFSVGYRVTDPAGATATSTITVNVTGPPPCIISTPTVTPSTVQLKKNNPDALRVKVTVSITIISGYCEGLALYYETGGPNGQSPINFGDVGTTRTVILPSHPSPELWSVGTKTLQVKDSSATVIGSNTLVVVK